MCRSIGSTVGIGLIGLLFLAGAEHASAQLSQEDIARLQDQAITEGWTFTVGENPATQYPLSELCGAVEPPNWRERAPFDDSQVTRGLPTAFDWRDVGGTSYVSPVRDQGACGSCWAFPPVALFESAILFHDGLPEIDLSEMWLVSCTSAGNCYNGGWHTDVFEYFRCNGWTDPCGDYGAVTEAELPYILPPEPCGCPYGHPYCIDRWSAIGARWGTPRPVQIKNAILNHGPVAACMVADANFQAYTGGIYNACNNTAWVNHVVAIVGWDDNTAGGIWIIRNSWGPNWGEHGYMRIPYDCSHIGYAACYLDYCCADCNSNGLRDALDIASGTSTDHNDNGVPDECDFAAGTSSDCNTNGIPDEVDIAGPVPVVRDDLPAVHGWVELAGVGEGFSLDDNGVIEIPMPFSNAFFHGDFVQVSNNGGLCAGGIPELLPNNEPIPNTNMFGGDTAFVPFWDDLDSDTGCLFHYTMGVAPRRTFIVEWYNRPHYPGDALPDGDETTFQVQIFERPVNGIFAQYVYLDVNFESGAYNNGASATIGFQRDGFHGPQWSFDQADAVTDGTVLTVQIPGPYSADDNLNGIPDECERCAGDANCDGIVSWRDIDHFLTAQDDNFLAWRALFGPNDPPCLYSNCDVNADGHVDWHDIDPFVGAFNKVCN